MRRALLIATAIIGIVVAWVVGGRQLVWLVDQFATDGEAKTTNGPFAATQGWLNVGDLPFELATPDRSAEGPIISIDGEGKVSLRIWDRHQSFPLGAAVTPAETIGPFDIRFAPDPGDTVTLRVAHSIIPWPSPFDLNFMTGNSPSWKRYTYYTVSWRKRDGAQLEMTWRYEQWFYDDWASPMMTHDGVTGLVSVRVTKG